MSGPGISGLFLLGGFSVLSLWLGIKGHFFSLDEQREKWKTPLSWFHVVGAFLCYFVVAAGIVPLAVRAIRELFPPHTQLAVLNFASWINLGTSGLILVFLLIYLSRIQKGLARGIFVREEKLYPLSDVKIALTAWLLSFPVVLFVSELLDVAITSFFHLEQIPEQIAVLFIKMTFAHPLYLILGGLTVIFLAPVIEEILFRGFLQSYLRQYLGSKQAIFLTALCFSFFHYSPEQGVGNIPIIGSLFVLALFLGLVYEKRGSLFASMTLHATFNTVSIVNLYFLSDFPKGPL